MFALCHYLFVNYLIKVFLYEDKTYEKFSRKVQESRKSIRSLIVQLNNEGKNIIGYDPLYFGGSSGHVEHSCPGAIEHERDVGIVGEGGYAIGVKDGDGDEVIADVFDVEGGTG